MVGDIGAIYWLKMTYNVFFFFIFLLSTSAQTAFNILKDHPQVNPDKIGLFGLSLGSIVAIYLTAESTVVKASIKCTISCSCLFFSLECVDVKLCNRSEISFPFADLKPQKELVLEVPHCIFTGLKICKHLAHYREAGSEATCIIVLCSSRFAVLVSAPATWNRMGRNWVTSLSGATCRYSVQSVT